MNKKYLLLFSLGGGIVLISGIFVYVFSQTSGQNSFQQPRAAVSSPTPSSQTANSPVQNNPAMSPEDVTNAFYVWYITYSGNPLTTGAYKKSTFLSNEFKTQTTEFMSSPSDSSYDPIFCADNKTDNFSIQPANYDNGLATVVIHDNTADNDVYRVVLEFVKNEWMIKDTICLP